ncbi:hypothetical protein VKT23_020199 [Stygiomarasmius scandens]|uniref:Maturase K n=1 Tax=Marasmiellus scandens TaxID=2682957 RepID=A0ABR1IJI7_9AGAR
MSLPSGYHIIKHLALLSNSNHLQSLRHILRLFPDHTPTPTLLKLGEAFRLVFAVIYLTKFSPSKGNQINSLEELMRSTSRKIWMWIGTGVQIFLDSEGKTSQSTLRLQLLLAIPTLLIFDEDAVPPHLQRRFIIHVHHEIFGLQRLLLQTTIFAIKDAVKKGLSGLRLIAAHESGE